MVKQVASLGIWWANHLGRNSLRLPMAGDYFWRPIFCYRVFQAKKVC